MRKTRKTVIGAAAVTTAVATLLLGAPAANADENGCNEGICIDAYGSGGHVAATRAYVSGFGKYLSFYGHYRVFGPDYSQDSPTGTWRRGGAGFRVEVNRNYGDGQQHCVEAWSKRDDGSHVLLGRPCVSNPI
ncbi:hypothetical protein [Lentzea sp. NPDC051838]|uniref:hypothetical protein n=1 Tax=Lentzea sp. NPDC051838 TaxID=3154849 RepID=UPI003449B9CD